MEVNGWLHVQTALFLGTDWMWGWEGSRAGLNPMEKIISAPAGNQTQVLQSFNH
jgi:hypothetical protein